jgi:VWFA-related protein
MDALNTTIPNQAYARQQMIRYMEKMPSNVPIAVYVLGQKLRMVQDFTSDPEILKKAAKSINMNASPLLDNPNGGSDSELYSAGMFEAMPQQVQESVQSFVAEQASYQTDMRVRYTMEALQSIARSLAGFPGRKNLIWISESFPLNISPDFTVEQGAEFSGLRSYGSDIAKTADTLIGSQVAIYPVDARGLVGPAFFSAASSGRDRYGRALRGSRMADQLARDSSQLNAAHDAMNLLADRTGGKAYYNRNDLDAAIRNSVEDGSVYYMLGYYPDNKDWNGKFRKLEIKVNRGGVKLRHRQGYYAINPKGYRNINPKERNKELGDALLLGSPTSTALFFQAAVFPPSEQAKNKTTIKYGIDPHALVFEREDDNLEHASVECVVQAYTEKGKLVNSITSKEEAALKPETFKKVLQTGFPCEDQIELPAGSFLLRLAIRDGRSGLIGSTNAKVTVPDFADAKKTPAGENSKDENKH